MNSEYDEVKNQKLWFLTHIVFFRYAVSSKSLAPFVRSILKEVLIFIHTLSQYTREAYGYVILKKGKDIPGSSEV